MSRAPSLLASLAALLGAAGVTLAAVAAHESGVELGRTAALFLILHAAAALGVTAHARVSKWPGPLLAIGFVMEAGAALFAGDLAARALLGGRLFPFAAPIGGLTMILSWLALAVAFAASGLAPRAGGPAP